MQSESSKDKLLIITQSFIRYKGDILSKHIFVAAKLLTRAGWKVSVLAPHERGLVKHETIEDIEIFRFRYFLERWEKLAYSGRMQELVVKNPINFCVFWFFLFFFLLRAVQLTKSIRPAVVHAHWWIPTGVLGYLVSRLRNVPLLVTLHGTDVRLIGRNLFFTYLAGRVFKRAAGITVVSDFIKSQLVGRLGVSPEKVFVLPMPIDPDKIFETEVPPQPRKTILSVARFTRQKNLDILIKAFHQVRRKWKELDLVIIGEGPERKNLERLISQLNLESCVRLYDLMSQEALNRFYNQCDIIVLPSIEEGFGLVLVEGQLCKKPVIGADSGGIPEVIQHDRTGLLFPPGDDESLSLEIERVLTDESLASRLSEAGYQSAKTKFSQEAFLDKYLKVLRWIQKKP